MSILRKIRSAGVLLGVFAAVVVFCLVPSIARAQATATLTGLVTDQTGATVPGASIKVTDPRTGSSYFSKTAGDGTYRVDNIPPGPGYSLTVTKDGFEQFVINNLYLPVGTATTQDAKLALGAVSQKVEVTAPGGAGSLNTTDASLGTVVEGDRVQDLPSVFVNSAAALLVLAPGVISGAAGDAQEGATTGTRADQANITLDGLDINDQRIGQAFVTVINTPLDAVQELKTTVAGDDTTYGHSAGGQVELVTKSGTNDFHGEAYELNRVKAYAANDFFNNFDGIPIPPLIRNQFGGDIGGPILKDRFFFFFTYNGLRQKASQQLDQIVPLDALRNGQLNYPIDASSNPPVFATTPVSGPNSLQALDPSGIGADPALLSFFNTRPYPHANNGNVGDGINTGGFEFAAPTTRNDNTYVGRLDYVISTNNKLFARGTWDRSVDSDDANFNVQTFPGDPVTSTIVDHSRSWVVGETWTATPNLANQASFGETNQTLVFPTTFEPTSPNLLSFFFFSGNLITPPYDVLNNGNATLNQQFPIVLTYQARDNVTWSKGKHTFQFGGVIRPIIFKSGNLIDFNTFTVGLGGFLDNLNTDPALRPSDMDTSNTAFTQEYDDMFALALGRYAAFSSGYNYTTSGAPLPQDTIPVRDYHGTEYEFFAQDSYKMRNDFTITYGLRYEFHAPLSEINGFESVPNLTGEQIFNTRTQEAAQGIEGPNAVPFLSYSLGGSANNQPGYYRPQYTNFAPRLGMAWSPSFHEGPLGAIFGDRKASLRAGFGINYDVNLIGQGFTLDETSYLFASDQVTNFGASGNAGTDFLPVADGGDPRFTGINPFPAPVPTGPSPRPSFSPNIDSNGIPIGFNDGGFGTGEVFNYNSNYTTPYEMNFNLSFQRELPGNWFVDVGYLGKLGRRLTAVGDAAQTLNFKDATSGQFLNTAFGNVQSELQANGDDFFDVTNQPWFENQMTAAANTAGFPTCGAVAASEFGPVFGGLSCTQLAAGIAGAVWPNGDVSSTLLDLAENHPDGNLEHGLLPLNAGLLAQVGAAGFIGNYGSSNYNALVLKVLHRTTHNLSMEFNYVYSHSIDNDSDIQNDLILYEAFGTGEVCDLRNLHICRASSDFDARHVAVANFDYSLPFGRGQWLGHDVSRPVDALVGGWKVSGIFTAHTGFPYKVDSGTFPVDFTQSSPAVFVGTGQDLKVHPHVITTAFGTPAIEYYANQANALGAWAFPFGGGVGDRNFARGPGFWNLDFAVLKDFAMPWSDSQKLEFRADAFNLFNHTNFTPPFSSLQSPFTFGTISSDFGPRNFQLGLKYTF
jgi:Carboxypeptidase regulatory-like domain